MNYTKHRALVDTLRHRAAIQRKLDKLEIQPVRDVMMLKKANAKSCIWRVTIVICDWYSGICVWDSNYCSNFEKKDLQDLIDSKMNMWQQHAITKGSVVCAGPTPEQRSSEKQKVAEKKEMQQKKNYALTLASCAICCLMKGIENDWV